MAYLKSSSCSSSSVPTGMWKYDVFLSFRGEDTRYTFVDHLYAALEQRGICVFKDDEELKKGKAISPELLKAIKESGFAVVVISKNYANSSWCLAELAKIMEWHNQMGQKVLPVFYHVDPSDIRGQKNDVAIFFRQHEEKYKEEMDKVKEWRGALTAIANLSGMHISETFKEGEAKYITKIVEEILGDIQPCDMEDTLVGINSHMDALNSLLETKEKEEVRIVEVSEKKIFLDITCFFKGRQVGDVTKVLESCGFDPLIGISVLAEKSLITICNEKIGMHDLILEMGFQIVHESYPNSRLWQLEDIQDSLKNNRKLKAIEAIVVSDKQYDVDEYEEKVGFRANVFKRMKNLRLLDIRGRFTSSEPMLFPDDLRWLCWSQYPFPSLPVEHMSKLVGLEVVGGSIKRFWNGQKMMPNLKFLKLQQLDGLTTFPDVSVAPNIEKLHLHHCTNLVEIHESLGSHKRLVKLYIVGCEQLKHLPSRIEMKSLKYLTLTKCSSLELLPDVSPCMERLSSISLDCSSSIEELPSSFGYLSSLCYLNLRRFTSHRNINTPKFMSLHPLTNLCSLKTLNLSCRQMESEDFPKNLHAFSFLKKLDISGNNRLIRLPESIYQLSQLRKLNLNECHRLQVLDVVPSGIQELQANNCFSLEKIKYLSEEHEWWYNFSLINCHKLLGDEDNERYLDKMMQQSFLKRCAVADHEVTEMAIPGNKIPSWFIEEQPGHNVAVMIPPNCNTQIIGVAVCGVFHGKCLGRHYHPFISIEFKKDRMPFSKKEVDCVNASASAAENAGNMWISYRPRSSFRGFQCEDWSAGTLLISITSGVGGARAVRCAARLMYKEDVEPNQQSISYTWMTSREKQRDKRLNYEVLLSSTNIKPQNALMM
ncbi:hypothetical protein L1987_65316 [Smallanthus sonchifolius]|uniref:Uncharacterized protein n=1 Tax=Smallanthus sonchifolius TaxID=185202 RepID=A0ACB9BU07_9ASTR|nr:hypothetical protein L1987_65316 [Smallanthus sonchifolius]